MGLQEQIAEAIMAAFDELGGDPQGAVEQALRQETVEAWIQLETATIAAAGGAEMLIPGLHALTIPAGITFLLHRMAYISRGIGALKGAYIVETAQYSDLRNILTLWGNESYYNMHILDFKAVALETFTYVLKDEGYATLEKALANAADPDRKVDAVIVNTLRVLKTLADEFSGDERAIRMVRVMTDEYTTEELLEASQRRVAAKRAEPIAKPVNKRISTRLALRLAGQISARVPAKLIVGFIPLAGAIVNAFFNAQTLLGMADVSRKYYANIFTLADLRDIAGTEPAPAAPAEEEAAEEE
jgi:hypothetical protein